MSERKDFIKLTPCEVAGDPAYFADGHVNKSEFFSAVMAYEAANGLSDEDLLSWDADMVRHAWHKESDPFDAEEPFWLFCKQGDLGAMPITEIRCL